MPETNRCRRTPQLSDTRAHIGFRRELRNEEFDLALGLVRGPPEEHRGIVGRQHRYAHPRGTPRPSGVGMPSTFF